MQRALKFSAVFGVASPKSPKTIFPFSVPPIEIVNATLVVTFYVEALLLIEHTINKDKNKKIFADIKINYGEFKL